MFLRELRHSHSYLLEVFLEFVCVDAHWGAGQFRNRIQQEPPLGTTLGTTPSSDFMGFYGGLKNIGRVLFPPDFQFDLRLVGDGGLEPSTPCL